MTSALIGKWKLIESDNFDEFLKEMGVGVTTRKLASNSKPSLEVKCTNGEWSFKTSTMMKSSEIKFKIGEEFEENRLDGAKVKTVVKEEGDKLVQVQYGDKEVTIVREVEGDVLKTTCTCGSVTAVRKYAKA